MVGDAVREGDVGQANAVLATAMASALLLGIASQVVLQVPPQPCRQPATALSGLHVLGCL